MRKIPWSCPPTICTAASMRSWHLRGITRITFDASSHCIVNHGYSANFEIGLTVTVATSTRSGNLDALLQENRCSPCAFLSAETDKPALGQEVRDLSQIAVTFRAGFDLSAVLLRKLAFVSGCGRVVSNDNRKVRISIYLRWLQSSRHTYEFLAHLLEETEIINQSRTKDLRLKSDRFSAC